MSRCFIVLLPFRSLFAVLLCADSTGDNLVVAEGGPKGIRKFVKLMVER